MLLLSQLLVNHPYWGHKSLSIILPQLKKRSLLRRTAFLASCLRVTPWLVATALNCSKAAAEHNLRQLEYEGYLQEQGGSFGVMPVFELTSLEEVRSRLLNLGLTEERIEEIQKSSISQQVVLMGGLSHHIDDARLVKIAHCLGLPKYFVDYQILKNLISSDFLAQKSAKQKRQKRNSKKTA